MIREFQRDTDAAAWAELKQANLNEFEASMLDPEFSATGMYVAEVDGKIVGIANAHMSPSHHEFCVLRDFKVKEEYWRVVSPSLLDTALNSLIGRGAKVVTRMLQRRTSVMFCFSRAMVFKSEVLSAR